MRSLEEEARKFLVENYNGEGYLPKILEDFVTKSKWVQTEKIKAQIEVLEDFMVIYKYNQPLIDKINQLNQQLKQLEDDQQEMQT